MTCSVCMELIMVKFGILPNCGHCYCLDCIMTWRKTLIFKKETRWGCPVCRVVSRFIIPSAEWLEEGSEAKNLKIEKTKSILAKQMCWYHSKGIPCPYQSCLYSHKKLTRGSGNHVWYSSFSDWNDFFGQLDRFYDYDYEMGLPCVQGGLPIHNPIR